MKKMTPSIIGTTLATAVAAGYSCYYNDPPIHLWTQLIREILLGGPVIVLITYSIATYFLETYVNIENSTNFLGKYEYIIRILCQFFLCLSLAALGENIQWYIILFTGFVLLSTIWSIASYRGLRDLVVHDVLNLVFCAIYAIMALHIYQIAHDFERTYPAFALDRESFNVRVKELRGDQVDYFAIMCAAVGAIVINLVLLVRGPWVARLRAVAALRRADA